MYQLEHGCVQVIIVLLFKQEQLHQLHYLSSLVPEQEEPLCLSVWPNLLLLCSIAPSFLLLRFLFHPLLLSQVNHNFTLRNPRFNSVSWVFVNCFGWEGVLNNWRYILYLKQESGLIWYWVGFGLVLFCLINWVIWFGSLLWKNSSILLGVLVFEKALFSKKCYITLLRWIARIYACIDCW